MVEITYNKLFSVILFLHLSNVKQTNYVFPQVVNLSIILSGFNLHVLNILNLKPEASSIIYETSYI